MRSRTHQAERAKIFKKLLSLAWAHCWPGMARVGRVAQGRGSIAGSRHVATWGPSWKMEPSHERAEQMRRRTGRRARAALPRLRVEKITSALHAARLARQTASSTRVSRLRKEGDDGGADYWVRRLRSCDADKASVMGCNKLLCLIADLHWVMQPRSVDQLTNLPK